MVWSDVVGALSLQVPTFSNLDFQSLCRVKNPEAIDEATPLSFRVRSFLNNTPNWFDSSEILLKNLMANGISWVSSESPSYPARFLWMQDPPPFLTYIGDISCAGRGILSVVGSREPSHLGREFLDIELGAMLKKISLTIVSGAARGIDQAAHSCAIRNKCPTIAVLPSGILNPYPRDFNVKGWYKPILDLGGCIISEYAPQKFMQRQHFFRRNQLIVGLTKFLLVVEARRRSGSMMTARHALNNHCNVVVVPGSPLDPQYGGNLDLLFDGGQMIRDHLDLIMLLAKDDSGHQN